MGTLLLLALITLSGATIGVEVPARGMIVGGAMLPGAGFGLTREMSRGQERRAVHPCQCA